MRIITSFILSLVCFSYVGVTRAAVFTDVAQIHPNADAISYVRDQGIVEGYVDGTYRPSHTINRAEFTKIVTLYRFGQKMVDMCGSKNLFSDLDSNAWYIKYICRARDAHMIEGYPDGTFRPDRNINFAEAAKIIAAASSQNISDPQLPTVTADAPWYESYVRFLAGRNAIPLTIISFEQNITRGEMAEMIYRLQADVTTKPSRTYEELIRGSIDDADWKNNAYPMDLPFSYSYPPDWNIDKIGSIPTGSVSSSHVTFEVREERELSGFSPQEASSYDGSFNNVVEQESIVVSHLGAYRMRGQGWSGGRSIAMEKIFIGFDNKIYSVTFVDWNLVNDIISSSQYAIYQQILASLSFTSSSASSSPTANLYQNMEGGWSVEYPSDWIVQEDSMLPSTDSFVNLDGRWTLFQAPGNTEAHVLVAFPITCPDLTNSFLGSGDTVNINGKTFTRAGGGDGAAGSIGEYAVYTYKQYSSPCVVMVTYFFHSTGDANDEPERSRIKQGNLEVKQSIERMVQSYRDL